MVLTQKELTLIKDLKGQEKLCIDKYKKHAACAANIRVLLPSCSARLV